MISSSASQKFDLKKCYKEAENLAARHYENFPVISYFLPKKFRSHVAVIYQFARTADDFADEGKLTAEERIHLLDEFENDFKNCKKNIFKNGFWFVLNDTIEKFNLSRDNFFNLLKAFKQDVSKIRYENFGELSGYCSNSANPVGRIMLELFNIRDEKAFEYSDLICSALQLANFWQDVSVDIKKNRIYIPLDEIKKFNVSEQQILNEKYSKNFKNLLKYQCERTERMFDEGKKLIPYLSGKFKFQIKMTVSGGKKILQKIKCSDYDVFKQRPKLSKKDYLVLFLKTLFN